jgi:tetratricopeptide (TPR) repeat protein
MPKKNPDKTLPAQPENTDLTQPSTVNGPSINKTVPSPATRKSSKNNELAKVAIVEPEGNEIPSNSAEEGTPQKRKRGGWIALGILAMLIIVFVGVAIGYNSAIQVRTTEEVNQRLIVATTQYELGLQDIKNANYDLAKKRLEYVIQIYPNYPGAADKLAQVLVAMAQNGQNANTTISVPTVEPTKDTRGAAAIFMQAQQQLATAQVDQAQQGVPAAQIAQDWQNLYDSVNSLRDLDPTYQAVKVDGLYYLALRNVGINNIKAGNLEVGIYQFSVAERIAPLDKDADNYRQLAETYINGSSFWGINWQIAVNNFLLLYQSYPYFSDFNGVTSKQRYAGALIGLGDTYETAYDWCDAEAQYSTSASIISSQSVTDKLTLASANCANPPATPTPTPNPEWTPTPTNAPGG